MNKVQKGLVIGGSIAAAAGSAFADGDLCTTLSASAVTSMGEIQTAVATLLTAALGIAVGFAVFGAIKKALNRGK